MKTRMPAVVGQFYPGSADALRESVSAYIESAQVDAAPKAPCALVAPHAGHVYSGACAGYAFARARHARPKRVVLLGRSHRYAFRGLSLCEESVFQMPLGDMPVDEACAKAVRDAAPPAASEAHSHEHALEVLLPFVQVAFGNIPIVPLLFGEDPDLWHLEFGRKLNTILDETDLLIASTDLSHFLSEPEARALDKKTLDGILAQDCAAVPRQLQEETASMCGGTAVVVAMAYALARGASQWNLLDYRTSADVSGDYDRVVGYGALSMEYEA